jgi:hypothetical protein
VKRVIFNFDERSLSSIDALADRGHGFTEITVRDPATGEQRKMLIPKFDAKRCPHCGGSLRNLK